MASSDDILRAFRELANTKQLEPGELLELLQDGIYAALAKTYGATAKAQVTIDEERGTIEIVLLKTVVETVEDAAWQGSLEEARFFDEEFEVGDTLETEIDFAQFGRAAVQ